MPDEKFLFYLVVANQLVGTLVVSAVGVLLALCVRNDGCPCWSGKRIRKFGRERIKRRRKRKHSWLAGSGAVARAGGDGKEGIGDPSSTTSGGTGGTHEGVEGDEPAVGLGSVLQRGSPLLLRRRKVKESSEQEAELGEFSAQEADDTEPSEQEAEARESSAQEANVDEPAEQAVGFDEPSEREAEVKEPFEQKACPKESSEQEAGPEESSEQEACLQIGCCEQHAQKPAGGDTVSLQDQKGKVENLQVLRQRDLLDPPGGASSCSQQAVPEGQCTYADAPVAQEIAKFLLHASDWCAPGRRPPPHGDQARSTGAIAVYAYAPVMISLPNLPGNELENGTIVDDDSNKSSMGDARSAETSAVLGPASHEGVVWNLPDKKPENVEDSDQSDQSFMGDASSAELSAVLGPASHDGAVWSPKGVWFEAQVETIPYIIPECSRLLSTATPRTVARGMLSENVLTKFFGHRGQLMLFGLLPWHRTSRLKISTVLQYL